MMCTSGNMVSSKAVVDTKLLYPDAQASRKSGQTSQAANCQLFAALMVVCKSNLDHLFFPDEKFTTEDEVPEEIVDPLIK